MARLVRLALSVAAIIPVSAALQAAAQGAEESQAPAEQQALQGQYQNGFQCIPGRCAAAAASEERADTPATQPAAAGGTLKTPAGSEKIWTPPDVVISSYQTGGSSSDQNGSQTGSGPPAPDALQGENRTLGVGLVVPAVQAGRDYAPPKPPPAPKPDSSKDDCMSCAD